MKVDPKIFQSVKLLELYARKVVDGFLSGPHRSLRSGTGMEFKQYRNYQPGDDIRLLDWKMFARSGKYFIKESEIDTDVTVRIVIDASASMLYEENGYSKIDYAKLLTIAISYLVLNQGDSVKVDYVNSSARIKELRRVNTMKDFQYLLAEIDNVVPTDQWPPIEEIMKQIPTRRKRLTLFITDLYQVNDEILSTIKAMSTISSEMMVFHLSFPDEKDFQFQGNIIFQDLETGEKLETYADSIKDQYLMKKENDLKEIKKTLFGHEIYYYSILATEPVEEALAHLLKHRDKLR